MILDSFRQFWAFVVVVVVFGSEANFDIFDRVPNELETFPSFPVMKSILKLINLQHWSPQLNAIELHSISGLSTSTSFSTRLNRGVPPLLEGRKVNLKKQFKEEEEEEEEEREGGGR